ncbi:MAG: hypothetical protein ACRD0J_08640 [Acidimicrobiales bacterium]
MPDTTIAPEPNEPPGQDTPTGLSDYTDAEIAGAWTALAGAWTALSEEAGRRWQRLPLAERMADLKRLPEGALSPAEVAELRGELEEEAQSEVARCRAGGWDAEWDEDEELGL